MVNGIPSQLPRRLGPYTRATAVVNLSLDMSMTAVLMPLRAEPVPSGAVTLEATVGGRRIEAAELAGDNGRRPLVLLHEGLGSVGLWRGFPAALQAATGRRVLAFSRFGHGRSAPPPAPRTPTFFH
jgi:hypothetical protein